MYCMIIILLPNIKHPIINVIINILYNYIFTLLSILNILLLYCKILLKLCFIKKTNNRYIIKAIIVSVNLYKGRWKYIY